MEFNGLRTIFSLRKFEVSVEQKNNYHISSVIRWIIFLPKQSHRSRSVLKDGSRSLGLFRKGKIGIIAKF